jgi:hypothetical protein
MDVGVVVAWVWAWVWVWVWASLLSPTNSWWNPRNEPEFENLRIFIKFSCVIPGSFLVHSHSIPGLLYQHQEWAGIFLRNPSGQTGSFPVIPYYYYIS